MKVMRKIGPMQRLARQWRSAGAKIGFVPTMGYLHAGHVSLMARARQCVGSSGRVVVSIYVNPTQFAPTEDLVKYPRDLPRDLHLCREAGVDAVFTPTDQEMYPCEPDEAFSTFVCEQSLSRSMEGRSRPEHFRGVTTVVAKLFNIVQPDVAVFGQKDFQQGAVVRRMVRDLNFPVEISMSPIVREQDGLALSSRNKYLSPAEREQAVALWQAIQFARKRLGGSPKGVAATALEAELKNWFTQFPAARVDYISFFDPASLEPKAVVTRSTQMALAVFIGRTRLIDNARL